MAFSLSLYIGQTQPRCFDAARNVRLDGAMAAWAQNAVQQGGAKAGLSVV
jgi:hypothetical protein